MAEHIATLAPQRAIDTLLPHVWFDPDWAVALPAAVAAHSDPDRILHGLLAHRPIGSDRAKQVAQREHDKLLLALAAETDPHDWSAEHQELIHRSREANAVAESEWILRSAHWESSNSGVRTALHLSMTSDAIPDGDWIEARRLEALLKLLESLNPDDVDKTHARTFLIQLIDHDLARGSDYSIPLSKRTRMEPATSVALNYLAHVVTGDAERAEARAAVLRVLVSAIPFYEGDRVAPLLLLARTESDKKDARATLLAALSKLDVTDTRPVVGLTESIAALDPTEVERATARRAVLAALASSAVSGADLARILIQLVQTEMERSEARAAVQEAMTSASLPSAPLVSALAALIKSDEEGAAARDPVWRRLATAAPDQVAGIATTLTSLNLPEAEQADLRTEVLRALSQVDAGDVQPLVRALLALRPDDGARSAARAAVLRALPGEYPESVVCLVDSLMELQPTGAEQSEARKVVVAALTRSDTNSTDELLEQLRALMPSGSDLAVARAAVLRTMPLAADAGYLVAKLMPLTGDDDDHAATRAQLLEVLSEEDNGWAIAELARAVHRIDPTEQEYDQIRAVLRDALALVGDNEFTKLELVKAMLDLEPSAEIRADMVPLLLTGLTTEAPLSIAEHVDTILRVDSTHRARVEVRSRLMQILKATRHPWDVSNVVDVLLPLGLEEEEKEEVRLILSSAAEQASGSVLQDVVAKLRALTHCDDWLGWLADDG